jgi:hypothetical protein
MSRDPILGRSALRALSVPLGAALIALTFSLTSAAQTDGAPPESANAPTETAETSRAPESPAGRQVDNASEAEPAAAAAAATRTADTSLEDDKANMIICRSESVIGTKIKRRRCATAAQWAETQRTTANNAEEGMRQIRERSTIVLNAPSGPPGASGN